MRIYIIGNDGITLSREAPAALNAGEIAVASIARRRRPCSRKRGRRSIFSTIGLTRSKSGYARGYVSSSRR